MGRRYRNENEQSVRWKNYPDAIWYVLKRMYPKEPIRRGGYQELYPEVVKEVNEKFRGIFKDTEVADYSGVFYVKERYGMDPKFGALKLQQVHPAKNKKSTKEKKALARAKKAVKDGGDNLVLCPHCEGNGFIDMEAVAAEEEMSHHSQYMESAPPSPVSFGDHSSVRTSMADLAIGENTHEGLQLAAENPGFVFGPAPMVPMPNVYAGPSQQHNQTPRPVAQYPLPNFDPNQMPQNNGDWNDNMMDGTMPNGLPFQPHEGQGQIFAMPHTNQPGWKNAMPNDTPIQPHTIMPQTFQPNQMGPPLRPGMANGPFPNGGGNVRVGTPGSGVPPQHINQAGQRMPHSAGGEASSHRNPMAGSQAATPNQPTMVVGSQIDSGYGLDNLGGDQDFMMDENFSFQQYLSENPDFFDV
ncbi:hypothetical protein ABKA04_008350 [Annulohypoxylon sp. FPYF3050]